MIKETTKPSIKPGYKKTPIGIIPEGWEVKKFEDLAKRSSKRFDPISGVSKKDLELDSFEQGTGRILNIYDSRDYRSSKNVFEKGDVLFGKLRPYLRKYWKATFDGVCSSEIWVFQNKKPILSDYLYLTLQTEYFINKSQITSGTKMPRAEWSSVKNAKLPIPPKEEQKSIADCLSTWDSGIERLTQLIQAKKQQKKGLMQQLLTGKKRLAGFDGEWKEVKFKNIFKKKKKLAGDIEYEILSVTKNGIVSQREYFNKVVASDETSNYLVIEKWDLVLSGLNFWMGSYEVLKSFEIGIISPAYKTFSISSNFNKEFIASFVRGEEFRRAMEGSSVQGASVVRRNMDKTTMENWIFKIPSAKEQTAIANILQTADKEIELLEQKLSSFLQQKKGLMQVLLTGEKRLIE